MPAKAPCFDLLTGHHQPCYCHTVEGKPGQICLGCGELFESPISGCEGGCFFPVEASE